MNIDLSKQDYCNILNFYNIKFNKNLPIKIIRKMTEKIIAEKLCRCIKKFPMKINLSQEQLVYVIIV